MTERRSNGTFLPGYRGGLSDGRQSATGRIYPAHKEAVTLPSLLRIASLPRRRQAILHVLARAYPASVPMKDIVAQIYTKAADDPMKHAICARTLIHLMRKDIGFYGWTISAITGRNSQGYRLCTKS